MGFTQRIKYFLVHTVKCTNKEADAFLKEGAVTIDGKVVVENIRLDETSEVSLKGKIVRQLTEHVYIKFYKPPGYESTLNSKVPDNLASFFSEFKNLAIAGRLDKASEGLLILSNNGKWIEYIIHPLQEKEKEYLVWLHKEPDNLFLQTFQRGVMLGDGITRPCKAEKVSDTCIKVTLTEGRNRQIRRMCHKLGYQVLRLLRTRIDRVALEDLLPGEKAFFKN